MNRRGFLGSSDVRVMHVMQVMPQLMRKNQKTCAVNRNLLTPAPQALITQGARHV